MPNSKDTLIKKLLTDCMFYLPGVVTKRTLYFLTLNNIKNEYHTKTIS